MPNAKVQLQPNQTKASVASIPQKGYLLLQPTGPAVVALRGTARHTSTIDSNSYRTYPRAAFSRFLTIESVESRKALGTPSLRPTSRR